LETVVKRLYEAMFLVDSAEAASDWDGVNDRIRNILERAEAEIVTVKKWDERKLAYEIAHKDRGTYILCYFRAQGSKIKQIERDVQLSEGIMRVLILRADSMSQEDIEKETPFTLAEKRREELAEAARVKAQGEQADEESAKAAEAQGGEVVAVESGVPEETEETDGAAAEAVEPEQSEEVDNGGVEASDEDSDKGGTESID